jgi:hypothetical protein
MKLKPSTKTNKFRNPIKFTTIGSLRNSEDSYRKKWLAKVEKLGKMDL